MSRKRRPEASGAERPARLWLAVLGISLVAVLAVAGLVVAGRPPATAPSVTFAPPPYASGTTKGLENAPVTIVEYSDFQCPYCARFAQEVEPYIDSEFVASGKVRVIFKQMVILGAESRWAAEASECAAEQGAFWAYHAKLFAGQKGEGQGAFRRERLEAFAREVGLDPSSFKKCLDSGKYAAKVAQDTEEGRLRGVRGTPTLFIGGQMVQGLLPFETLRQVIASELAKSGP